MDKTKVFLCVPCRDGGHLADITVWLEKMIRWGLEDEPLFPFDVRFGAVKGCEPVEFARNRMVEEFLKTDNDVLWMVDADMVPMAYSHHVLQGPGDVNAGPCPMFSQVGGVKACRPNLFAGNVGTMFTRAWAPGDVPIAAGTANMAIKRKVLEDPEMKTPNGGVFQKVYGHQGSVVMGEDVDFCLRVQRCGHSFHIVGQAQMGHVKPVDLGEVFKCVSDQVVLLNDTLRAQEQTSEED